MCKIAAVLPKFNGSLERHIRTVHKKERSHVCYRPKCDASFRSAYDLKRHCLGVHIKERNFKCSQCPKAFTTYDALHKHERSVHGEKIATSRNTIRFEKLAYECAECGFNSTWKYTLVRHISTRHGDNEYFECHTCGCRFNSKKYLETHIFTKHRDENQRIPMENSLLRCIICKNPFQFLYQIENHYQEFHRIDLSTEKLSFPNVEEFFIWKQNIEDSTKTRFNLRTKAKWKLTYICHRSGLIRAKTSDRKIASFLRVSKKLDGVCTASITLRLNRKDSSCIATFLQTHVGHLSNDKSELKYCFHRPGDPEKLAEMVASGISKRKILDDRLTACNDPLYDFESTNVARNYLLTNKDSSNMEKTCDVKSFRGEEDPDMETCYLMCYDESGECDHECSCSCIESAIQSHMGKQIHAVLSYESIEIVNDCDESSLDSTDVQPLIVDVINPIPLQSIDEENPPISTECASQTVENAQEKADNDLKKETYARLEKLIEAIPFCVNEDINMINRYLDHMEAVFLSSKVKSSLPL